MSRQDYLFGKFGNAASTVYGRITALAAKAALISILIRSNARQIAARHIAIYGAAAVGSDLSDAFLGPTSSDGRDLGDEVELSEIAREQGVNIPPEILVDPP